jgi:hypothetical protein
MEIQSLIGFDLWEIFGDRLRNKSENYRPEEFVAIRERGLRKKRSCGETTGLPTFSGYVIDTFHKMIAPWTAVGSKTTPGILPPNNLNRTVIGPRRDVIGDAISGSVVRQAAWRR